LVARSRLLDRVQQAAAADVGDVGVRRQPPLSRSRRTRPITAKLDQLLALEDLEHLVGDRAAGGVRCR
jgi:hypothetical protein